MKAYTYECPSVYIGIDADVISERTIFGECRDQIEIGRCLMDAKERQHVGMPEPAPCIPFSFCALYRDADLSVLIRDRSD